MQRIFKYTFIEHAPNPMQSMQIAPGRVVLVGVQDPEQYLPTVWVLHTSEDDKLNESQYLQIRATGTPFSDEEEHVGSAICYNGELVWHVVRVKAPT